MKKYVMQKSCVHYSRGFSLVEVVLALGVLSFSLVGMFGLMAVVLGSVRDSMDLTTQALIVQNLSSEVREINFSQLAEDGVYESGFPRAYGDTGVRLADGSSQQEGVYQVAASVQTCRIPAIAGSDAPARRLTFRISSKRSPSRENVYTLWIVDNGR